MSGPKLLHFWRSTMVDLSFEHPWLLQAILAVAALHKAVTSTQDKMGLYQQSLRLMDGAISGLQQNLGQPDITTCSPLFATASLLVIHSMGAMQIGVSADPIYAVSEWMHLVKGTVATITTYWEERESLDIAPLLRMGMAEPYSHVDTAEILRLEDLVQQQQPTLHPTHRDACLKAITDLNDTSARVRSAADASQEKSQSALAMGLPANLSLIFIDMLADKHPVALVILAHFVVLFEVQDSRWFVQHWATSIISAIETSIDPQLHMWLEWPKSQLRSEAAS